MYVTKTVSTQTKGSLVEITEAVRRTVAESGIDHGIAVVRTLDTTAGILCTSFYDPKGHEDIIDDFTRIFPARDNFHWEGTVTQAAAHSKASVAGMSMDFIVENGELALGSSQGVFLAEYCLPQCREYGITVLGEK